MILRFRYYLTSHLLLHTFSPSNPRSHPSFLSPLKSLPGPRKVGGSRIRYRHATVPGEGYKRDLTPEKVDEYEEEDKLRA